MVMTIILTTRYKLQDNMEGTEAWRINAELRFFKRCSYHNYEDTMKYTEYWEVNSKKFTI